jgi:hypothetical protein
MNRESKCCMERLIGKLRSISAGTKSFKNSKNRLHSRWPAENRKKLDIYLGSTYNEKYSYDFSGYSKSII